MRFKCYAVRGNLSVFRKRVDLITTAVRQDRPLPAIESVKPSSFFKRVEPRPQIKMIGISKNDFRINVGFELALVNGFNGPGGAYWHEYRSRYFAMGCGDGAGSGLR